MDNSVHNKRGLETRNKLITAGLSEFHSHGFNGVGIGDIVKTAGVPKGSFYNLFESKEAFAAEVVDHYFELGLSKLNEFFGNADLLPVDRLRGYFGERISHFATLGFRRGCLMGNFTLETADESDLIRGRLAENFQIWSAIFASTIEEAQQAGSIKNGMPASVLADFVLNSWEGAMLRMKAEKSVTPLEEATEVILQVVLV
ncbi:TetR family transcriptional regulator C-terminal domain-containing protein [Cupriavidus sp. 2TAF22]|uniref:TetR/AcrR family transcriptional regulator n=1 Tax=unclassified Cupriavidus TaxID=2640874 RepID=UPI003F92E5DD